MQIGWDAPGPGTWELDAAHFPASVSRIVRDIMTVAVHDGLTAGFDLIGAPLSTMDVEFVNGHMYRRLTPLIGGNRSATPPAALLWLATRLHPAFRRRSRRAAEALRDRVWLAEARRWESDWKPALIAENRRLGVIDERSLDDVELAAHIGLLNSHLGTTTALHFRLHTSDLGPIGLALVKARGWRIDERSLMRALGGSSPSTSDPARLLERLRAALREAGVDLVNDPPTSLDDVRRAGAAPSELLDEYLDLYGSRLTTGYDISDLTLAEMPDLVLASLRGGRFADPLVADVAARAERRGADALDAIRSGIAPDDLDEFDTLVADARLLYGLRDANGPLTYQWPAGILRRSVLEAARRLVASGRLVDHGHVFDLAADELGELLGGATVPSVPEVAARYELRQQWCQLDAPRSLGPPPTDPPIDVLPSAMATMMRVTLAVSGLLEAEQHDDGFAGTGIGAEVYTGTARVVVDADDALDRVEPGDVIVARLTVPTFNAVLAIAGAVITENGGLLCHTAVIARELGIPAVVGVADALTSIPDGSTVEVDPSAGRVRVVTSVRAAHSD